tara:strand:- start:1076 stop:1741 length:666 start_codon:yes stop_codon:yes gene_type:complete
MESSMDFEQLQSAWQSLDKNLDRQNSLLLEQSRDRKLLLLRKPLQPLQRSQTAQILFGIAMTIFSVSVWTRHPVGGPLFIAAVVMHLYGIAMAILGGVVQGLIRSVDMASQILTIQKKLARLRKVYVICSMALGLVWWVLWIPFMMMVFDVLFGADMYVNMGMAIKWLIVGGFIGLALTVMIHRWALRHPRFGKIVEASAAGINLNRAQLVLDDILEFESV